MSGTAHIHVGRNKFASPLHPDFTFVLLFVRVFGELKVLLFIQKWDQTKYFIDRNSLAGNKTKSNIFSTPFMVNLPVANFNSIE